MSTIYQKGIINKRIAEIKNLEYKKSELCEVIELKKDDLEALLKVFPDTMQNEENN